MMIDSKMDQASFNGIFLISGSILKAQETTLHRGKQQLKTKYIYDIET